MTRFVDREERSRIVLRRLFALMGLVAFILIIVSVWTNDDKVAGKLGATAFILGLPAILGLIFSEDF